MGVPEHGAPIGNCVPPPAVASDNDESAKRVLRNWSKHPIALDKRKHNRVARGLQERPQRPDSYSEWGC
jgi:hypothetical protein